MGFRMVEGNAECVEFSGKRWIAGLRGETIVEREIPEWDPAEDWALEFNFYISEKYFGDILRIAIGKRDGPYILKISGGDDPSYWSDRPLPDIPRPAARSIHHVAIQKKGEVFSIFFNGKRIYTAMAGTVSLSHLPETIFLTLGTGSTDISAGRYVLITDLKLTQY